MAESDGPLDATAIDFAISNKAVFDVLFAVLLHDTEETLIPEIYEIFGAEYTIKFLELFAGTVVTVPDRNCVEQAMMDMDIFLTLSEAAPDEQTVAVQRLALKYDRSADAINNRYKRTGHIVQHVTRLGE